MKIRVGEREEKGLTACEEHKLIEFLEKKGWTAAEILALLKYIR